jgi:hypothetical protein
MKTISYDELDSAPCESTAAKKIDLTTHFDDMPA